MSSFCEACKLSMVTSALETQGGTREVKALRTFLNSFNLEQTNILYETPYTSTCNQADINAAYEEISRQRVRFCDSMVAMYTAAGVIKPQ